MAANAKLRLLNAGVQ